jgi:dTDP-4-dehydrorhamnose 3,5-epimerase-like enzyme
MKKTTVKDCKVIDLPVFSSKRKGNITTVYNNEHIPFEIKRVYYLYDVPSGSERGVHAHKELKQLFVAASGSFDVIIDDGKNKKTFPLNRPNFGLYVPPMMWREITNFSGGGICLVLASLLYDEEDYYRDYKEFLDQKWTK